MRIQNNITADNSHRQLGLNTRNTSSNTEKLSSGFRVNRAADDAAGLAISEKMRTQIRGLNRASLNIQDGVSLLQVGDGALQFVHNKMQRMRELAVQAANDTNQLMDREAIQLEFGQLTSEINDAMNRTNFNDKILFDGSIGASWEYNLGRITTLPFNATILAGQNFDAGNVIVPGWTTPPGFGAASVPPPIYNNLNPNNFPQDGVFAMQLATPAHGTVNVIMDFADVNHDGNLNLTGFMDYFAAEFNKFFDEPFVERIFFNYDTFRIEFEFPKNGDSIAGIMGYPPMADGVILDTTPLERMPWAMIGLGAGNDFIAQEMRNSLNGQPTMWSSAPVRTNRPDLVGTFNETTNFRNTEILGANTTIPFPNPANPPAGGFANFTINVNSRPVRVNIAPGIYDSIEDFIERNKKAFESAQPHSFDLDVENGKLVLKSAIHSGETAPTVSLNIHPLTLAAALGFIPHDIDVERDPGGSLIIQSGANEPDIVHINIPRLCTRSLGLSIRRPTDMIDPHPEGFEHINRLAHEGYALLANVSGTPMEYSLDVTSHDSASAAMTVLTNAINIISTERARMGAQQNRLEFTMQNADNTSENLQAAESRIRDTDMAREMTIFTKNQILLNSSTAMLAQANALPQGVLQLLS